MIEAMNAQPAPVVAVDLPSGINGTTGAVMGAAVKATRDRHVLSQEARPSSCCRAGFIAGRSSSPISAFRLRCSRAIAPRHSRTCRRSGARIFRCRVTTATNTTAATPSWCRVRHGRPARRGLRRAARCAPAQAWSPSLARARRWRSMPPRTSRSWCGRSMAPPNSPTFLADRRFNAVAIGPGVGVGEATCELVLAALAGERAVVLDADAITSFAQAPGRLAERAQGAAAAGHDPDPARGRILSLFRCVGRARLKPDRSLREPGLRPQSPARSYCSRAPIRWSPRPTAAPSIAANAPAFLATAGAGDVLAGIAAGLLAQACRPSKPLRPRSGCTARPQRLRPGLDLRGPAGDVASRLPGAARLKLTSLRTSVPDRACEALDQPFAGIVGNEGDPRFAPRLNRHRIEPERFPAVIKRVEKTKTVSVQMDKAIF